MTESIKSITITNICQADKQKKGDTRSTKDSTGSSESTSSCNDPVILGFVDLYTRTMQKQTEEEDDAKEDEAAENAEVGDASR